MAHFIRTTLLALTIAGAWYVLLVAVAFGATLALDGLYDALGLSAVPSTLISMTLSAAFATAVVGTAVVKARPRLRSADRAALGRRDDLEAIAEPAR